MGIIIIIREVAASVYWAPCTIQEAWCKVNPLQTSFHITSPVTIWNMHCCVNIHCLPMKGFRFRTFMQISQFHRGRQWQNQVMKELLMVSEVFSPPSCNICILAWAFWRFWCLSFKEGAKSGNFVFHGKWLETFLFTASSVHGKNFLWVCGGCVQGRGSDGKGRKDVRNLYSVRGYLNTFPAFIVSIVSFCFQFKMCIFCIKFSFTSIWYVYFSRKKLAYPLSFNLVNRLLFL